MCIRDRVINGEEKVISYGSKSLSKGERNLHPCEKELLAILWALNKFRDYLFMEKFSIITDNQALKYLNKFKDESTKLGRWSMQIAPFADRIYYRPGKENVVADALSRGPVEPVGNEPDFVAADPDVMFVPSFGLTYNGPGAEEIRAEQRSDQECQDLIRKLTFRPVPDQDGCGYVIDDGILKKMIKLTYHIKKNNIDDQSGSATR